MGACFPTRSAQRFLKHSTVSPYTCAVTTVTRDELGSIHTRFRQHQAHAVQHPGYRGPPPSSSGVDGNHSRAYMRLAYPARLVRGKRHVPCLLRRQKQAGVEARAWPAGRAGQGYAMMGCLKPGGHDRQVAVSAALLILYRAPCVCRQRPHARLQSGTGLAMVLLAQVVLRHRQAWRKHRRHPRPSRSCCQHGDCCSSVQTR